MNFIGTLVFLSSITLLADQFGTQLNLSSEAVKCQVAGGVWREFGSGCTHTECFSKEEAKKSQNLPCPDVMTSACDCGSDKCFDLKTSKCKSLSKNLAK
jgi:hypothetical protein